MVQIGGLVIDRLRTMSFAALARRRRAVDDAERLAR
jgi:hypothetical protein